MSSAAANAVFLSYASQDADVARRIADALRGAGVEVWFDQSELVGGDAWDAKIRGQIASCALFVPIVSANTQARLEGYFRIEWKLAAQRTHAMAEAKPFLLPVVIDATRDAEAHVPGEFRVVQWTRLRQGYGEPARDDASFAAFGARVGKLLQAGVGPAAGRAAHVESKSDSAAPGHRPGLQRSARRWLVPVIVAVGLLGALAAWQPWRVTAEHNARPASVAPRLGAKSIVVLPFENLSADKDANAHFVEGMHEDVVTNLLMIRDLRCVPRATAVTYRTTNKTDRAIAEELGVAYVLRGSVRRADKKVRLTSTLIDARTDEVLWNKPYDKNVTDTLEIQSELAQAIAGELKAALSPQEKQRVERRPTANTEAYDFYLRARQRREETVRSGALFEVEALLREAVKLDPRFAAAWAELGDVCANIYYFEHDTTAERAAAAKLAIDTAVGLAPDDPAVIARLGDYYFHSDRDYARATEQYLRLVQIRPNDPGVLRSLAEIQSRQGRWADAILNLRQAMAIDPVNFKGTHSLLEALLKVRRYEEAETLARQRLRDFSTKVEFVALFARITFCARGSTAEMEAFAGQSFDPASTEYVTFQRKRLARMRADFKEAVRLDRLQPVFADGSTTWSQHMQAAQTLDLAGDAAAARARAESVLGEMQTELERQPQNSWLWACLGQAYALLGDKARALDHARKSVEILPPSRDALWGVENALMLASLLARFGEKDAAFAELARLLKTPHGGNVFVARSGGADFDTATSWAPLLDDPRFQVLMNDPTNNAPLF